MVFDEDRNQRAEAFRIFADLFLKAPDADMIESLRNEFALDSMDSEYAVLEDFENLLSYPAGSLQPIESLHLRYSSNMIPLAVTDFYASAGLSLDESILLSRVPDHLCLELLFMSFLITHDYIDMQRRFFEQHILNWVIVYCEKLRKTASTLFYQELSDITRNFLQEDYKVVLTLCEELL